MINKPTTVNHPVWLDWYNIDISSKYRQDMYFKCTTWRLALHSWCGQTFKWRCGDRVPSSHPSPPSPPTHPPPPYHHLGPCRQRVNLSPLIADCSLGPQLRHEVYDGPTTATTRGVRHLPHTYHRHTSQTFSPWSIEDPFTHLEHHVVTNPRKLTLDQHTIGYNTGQGRCGLPCWVCGWTDQTPDV